MPTLAHIPEDITIDENLSQTSNLVEMQPLTHIPEDISSDDITIDEDITTDEVEMDDTIKRYIKSMFPNSYETPTKQNRSIPPRPSTPRPLKRKWSSVNEDDVDTSGYDGDSEYEDSSDEGEEETQPSSPLVSLSGLVSKKMY